MNYRLFVSRWCFLTRVQLHQQMGKKLAHAGMPLRASAKKFLSLMRHNLFMGVNENAVYARKKILPLLCRLGLVLRLGSV